MLGIFAGIFTSSLIVLRTICGGDEGGFVPSLSVAVSVMLAIGGFGVLIFFIHHIASSIQASSVIASVAAEILVAVDRIFRENLGQESGDAYNIDRYRTVHQDAMTVVGEGCASGFRQLVDMALRALSPGIDATVGVAMGVGGTAVALETADVVLMGGDRQTFLCHRDGPRKRSRP